MDCWVCVDAQCTIRDARSARVRACASITTQHIPHNPQSIPKPCAILNCSICYWLIGFNDDNIHRTAVPISLLSHTPQPTSPFKVNQIHSNHTVHAFQSDEANPNYRGRTGRSHMLVVQIKVCIIMLLKLNVIYKYTYSLRTHLDTKHVHKKNQTN